MPYFLAWQGPVHALFLAWQGPVHALFASLAGASPCSSLQGTSLTCLTNLTFVTVSIFPSLAGASPCLIS